jgi:hypothetical protein
MDKATFIETLHAGRAEWQVLLAEVGEARMLQPGAAGEWSVKDVIAHVMWGEREMVGVMRAHALIGSDLWDLSEDERNAIMVTEKRNRPLQEVLTEEQQVYAQFLEAVQALSDEDFTDPRRFREMPEQWLPWRILAGCSFAHYRQHTPSIRAWLSSAT